MGCTSSLDQPAAASRAYREHDVAQPRQQPSCSGAASVDSGDGGDRDAADVVQFVTLGNLPPVSHQAKRKHPSPGPRPCGAEGVKACASPVSAFSPTTAVPDKRSSTGGVRIMKGFGSFGAGSPVAAARIGSIGGFTTSLNAATWGSAAALLSPDASVNPESRGPLWSTRTNGDHEEGDGDGAPSEEEAASERSALLSSSSSSEGEDFSRVATLTACVCGTSAADSAVRPPAEPGGVVFVPIERADAAQQPAGVAAARRILEHNGTRTLAPSPPSIAAVSGVAARADARRGARRGRARDRGPPLVGVGGECTRLVRPNHQPERARRASDHPAKSHLRAAAPAKLAGGTVAACCA
eukprot:CAMPEP_0174852146 /NCGR_PEP_ID=MMETSP1114-20130205/25209_1 /TAXON_ID=312471 /ORGANISM="Neobodo designis, Strain CCAP 1951/1" /LENGTH=353 /DNA_ID=CAMNT_0016086725 /DNA_START=59 /DNA_END=1119 /DNA_ORIENTATION=-